MSGIKERFAAITIALSSILGFVGTVDAKVIGAFDFNRGFITSNLVSGSATSQFRTAILDAGHTISGSALLTPGYLASVDVFITGALQGFGGASSPGAVQAGELSALQSWLNGGGTFIITGEHSGFKDTYNTWLNPFGIELDGVAANYNVPAPLKNEPTDPYLLNGIAGMNFPIDNRGFYDVIPTGTDVLAMGAGADDNFIIRKAVGSGFILAIADTYFLTDNIFNPTGVQLVLNAVDAAGAQGVPVPSVAMLAFGGVVGVWMLSARSGRRRG